MKLLLNRWLKYSLRNAFLDEIFFLGRTMSRDHWSRLTFFFLRKMVNIFLSISYNICFGCSNICLIEMGISILSTRNICFGCEIKNKK